MAGFVRVSVDVPGLVTAIVAYLNDPRADRNAHHPELLSDEMEQAMGLTQDLLECLVLDGVTDIDDVAPLVAFLATHGAGPEHHRQASSLA
jgi:hypothetical protein